jgi:hypothetical protein
MRESGRWSFAYKIQLSVAVRSGAYSYDVLSGDRNRSGRPEVFVTSLTTHTMRTLYQGLRPIYAPLLHPKHNTRIPIASGLHPSACVRSFHASASWRTMDLAFDLHDNGGQAKGAPILILHGLFGSKKNNRSISKYVAALRPRSHILNCIRTELY